MPGFQSFLRFSVLFCIGKISHQQHKGYQEWLSFSADLYHHYQGDINHLLIAGGLWNRFKCRCWKGVSQDRVVLYEGDRQTFVSWVHMWLFY